MTSAKKHLHHFIGAYPILFFLSIVVLAVLIGTVAFVFVEGRDLFNAFYFTSITMATVGYGDVSPVTHAGKVLAIIYGFMGAPLFIGLTGILFQSKFQKLVKTSIHAYHKEIKEAQKVTQELVKESTKIQEMKEKNPDSVDTKPVIKKKSRIKRLFTRG